jgi:DNA-binding CsgD family transcriptional regulator
MGRLADSDLRAILDLTLELRSFADVPSYRAGVLSGLLRLVPADVAGYNEVDREHGTTVVVSSPAGAFFDGVEELFASVVHQHPIVARAQAGDRATYKLSDFLSERQYHRLELYQDMYRQIDTEDQIAFGLPGEQVVGLALNRPRRSFTERDRELLEVLRPHIADAHARVRDRELASTLLAALGTALEAAGAAAVVINQDWRIGYATEAGAQLLSSRLGTTGAGLPPVVSEWLATGGSEGPSEALVIEHEDGGLVIRLLPSPADRTEKLLLLEHQLAKLPSTESLRRLGLTRRQSDVLRLVAAGETNDQIARELFVSPFTVRKHLEHIYTRLGVSTRTAAAARANAARG